MKKSRILSIMLCLALILSSCASAFAAEGAKWTAETMKDGWIKITQEGGQTLGYSPDSGVTILEADGYAFKDLNKNGELDAYEDWRLTADERATDLVSKMAVEDKLPLMLLNGYDMNYKQGSMDSLKDILDAGIRASCSSFSIYAANTFGKMVNLAQAYLETNDKYGIPLEICAEIECDVTSNWPGNLMIGATMDVETAFNWGKQMSKEFRAIGISGSMTPQTDVTSDPRWSRYTGTYGEDPSLSAAIVTAFINGYQSTFDEEGNDLGWGSESVLTQIKHFPGEGSEEGGRNSHNDNGKYAIYPNDGLDTLIEPFRKAMELTGETKQVSGVMPCYSILINEDGEPIGDEPVASAYNATLLQEILREELGFDGVISTDFEIINGRNYGVAELSVPERYLKAIMAGVDRFGAEKDVEAITEAYKLGVAEYGEEEMNKRIDESAFRLLRNYFRVRLFENAYTSQAYIKEVVNSKEAQAMAADAKQESLVLIKNAGNIIKASESDEKPTVYIPYLYTPASSSWMGEVPESWDPPMDLVLAAKYFNVVTDHYENGVFSRATAEELAGVDYAFVRVSSPSHNGGYSDATQEYLPVSLQYGEYTATNPACKTSFAGDDTEVVIESPYGAQTVYTHENRSYYGKTVTASNIEDLNTILYAAENCEHVIVNVSCSGPMIVSEFEDKVDAILIDFNGGIGGFSFMEIDSTPLETAILDTVTGKAEPRGLLPMQFPADMETVEEQQPDICRDVECHVDSEGNTYDFAFGLNWSGVIKDERVETYYNDPLLD